MLTNTALLLFTRTAASEAVNKAFVLNNKRNNFKIATLLIENIRKIACSSGLPTYEINELNQVGSTFGERLSNAMGTVFEDGFENIIVIGNDCCKLTADHLKKVHSKLQQHDLVLGPDSRGGIYLIGINKNIFDKASFSSRQWQTPNLFKDLEINLRKTSLYTLPVLKDANNFFDLIKTKNQLPSFNKIKAFIVSLLASAFKGTFFLPLPYINPLFFVSGLRAPPTI